MNIAFLCFVYCLGYILFLFPLSFFSLYEIKGHDFGMYAAIQILFCCIILWAHLGQNINIRNSRGHLAFIMGLGVILRVVSWYAPYFTTDVHRYLSDGLNMLSGENPYQSPPIGENVSYPTYRTIYPPLTQVHFTLAALIFQKEIGFKIIFGLLEMIFLVWIYRKFIFKNNAHLKTSSFYFFTLNPLLIFECHAEGHAEILSAALFIYSTFFLHLRRYSNRRSAITPAFLSFASKFHGLLLYPLIFLGSYRVKHKLLWGRSRGRSKGLSIVFLTGVLSVLVLLPFYMVDIETEESGIHEYFQSWSFSSGLFYFGSRFFEDSRKVIDLLQGSILIFMSYTLVLWFWAKITTHQFILRCILGFLFLFPVQHPWYSILGSYGILFSRKYRLFWMLLLGCMGLNYLNYGEWSSPKVYEIVSWSPWILSSFLYFAWFLIRRIRVNQI